MSLVKKFIFITLLSAAAFLLNRFRIDIVFGIDFILGSIPVLIAAVLLGPVPGVITATAACISTFFLWNHFYAFPAFIFEALFIGLTVRKIKWSIIALDIIYWSTVGIGIVYISYYAIGDISFENTTVIALKQAVNGIVNSALAIIILLLVQLIRPVRVLEKRKINSLANIFFMFITIFTIISLMSQLSLSSKRSEQIFFDTIADRLKSAEQNINNTISIWAATYFNLAESISRYPVSEVTAGALGLFRNKNLDVHSVYITDAAGRTVLTTAQPALEKVFFGDYLPSPHISRMISDTKVVSGIADYPLVVFSAPRFSPEGIHDGWTLILVDINHLYRNLMSFVENINQNFELTEDGHTILSLLKEEESTWDPAVMYNSGTPLSDYSGLIFAIRDDDVPNIERNRGAILLRKGRIKKSGWEVIVSESSSNLFDSMFDLNTRYLSSILLFLIVIGMAAMFMTRRIVKPLTAIASISDRLSSDPESDSRESWPDSRISEITSVSSYIQKLIDSRQEFIKEIRESNRKLTTTLMSIGDGVIATDIENRIIMFNYMAAELTGWQAKDAAGRDLDDVLILFEPGDDGDAENKKLDTAALSDTLSRTEFILASRDGKEYRISGNASPIMNDNEIIGTIVVFHDETERINKDNQLKQAQKMESIGRLAGGIAHDFNNLLSGIISYADVLDSRLGDSKELRHYCKEILDTGEKAADLTQQLLSFARKGSFTSRDVELHELIGKTLKLLKTGRNKHIETVLKLDADESTVSGDEAMMQSMLLNLGLNAKDAMPDGGTIRFTTENCSLSPRFCAASTFDLAPGPYILLRISDTGTGIESSQLQHIFEPFFTTKEAGAGVGLGLSAVYGTVIEMNGAIFVSSIPGEGTEFRIFLPVKPMQ